MKIAVIGTGYVGLVTSTCLAESGNDVIGIDKDASKIEMLENGRLPIYEPGLLELVHRNRRDGRLAFTTDLAQGLAAAHIVFVAVGTPQSADGSADLASIWAVADDIAAHAAGPKLIVLKSTVPVGTNQAMADRLASRSRQPLEVASNPEFLKEGAAVDDFMRPDRVVVGVRRAAAAEKLRELYAPFLRTERPFLVMSPESAEMTKYVANAMLAAKISFINEMANLCERMGADINDVRRGIGHDARIGFQFLFPGAGFGGSCFEGEETVFILNSPNVAAEPLDRVFARAPEPVQGEGVEVIEPADCRVLAFDLQTGLPALATVKALTRRRYQGTMVTLKTSMGRTLRVTADHPVIVRAASGFSVVPAIAVAPGDELSALCQLPAVEPPGPFLNLIDLLRGTELENDVLVSSTEESFAAQYNNFKRHIPREIVSAPSEYKRRNCMPLPLLRHLRSSGVLAVPDHKLQLFTAKGAATKINAVIPIDADLLRFCGYYVAEGYISQDIGRAGAVRERLGLTFNENETEYIQDAQRILRNGGLKFIEHRGPGALTTLVSSRVLAWLVRDVLRCGTGSENKALPRLAFNVPEDLRRELVRGAFSGDGAVTLLQKGRNLMLEYATVSKLLADGLALLLQSLGIVPSLRKRWMNNSKQPAYLLRVSGYSQLEALREVFGNKHQAQITSVLSGYQRHIRQRGFTRRGPYVALTVRAVHYEDVDTQVYSLETSTGTVIASSGLVAHNCFPKDVYSLIHMARRLDVPVHLMEAVNRVNEAQKHILTHKIRRHYGNALADKTLAIWGLAFKPRTDDIREAPALTLIDDLLRDGVQLRVHDPEAMANVRARYGDQLIYCDRPYGTLEGADGLAIVTEWQEFRHPDFEVMRRLLREPVIFDGRNLYEPKPLAEAGFTYYAIGRTTPAQGSEE
jgi:UDPglucose 6-dehydrogenase